MFRPKIERAVLSRTAPAASHDEYALEPLLQADKGRNVGNIDNLAAMALPPAPLARIAAFGSRLSVRTQHKRKGFAARGRLASPLPIVMPQTPPPLPPWPPGPYSRLSMGRDDAFAAHALVEHVALPPKGVLKKPPVPVRQAPPIAAAQRQRPRPTYDMLWPGPQRTAPADWRVAGRCIFETMCSESDDALRALIVQDPKLLVTAEPEYARIPIAYAALHGRLGAVRVLASAMQAYGRDRHGELDAGGLDYRTPLMLAIDGSTQDSLAILEVLLAAGASVHCRTPFAAGRWGSFFLLSCAPSGKTQNAAEYAIRRGHAQALDRILQHDARTRACGGRGSLPLDIDGLAAGCQGESDTAVALKTVLRQARQRRQPAGPPADEAELARRMARLSRVSPGPGTPADRFVR